MNNQSIDTIKMLLLQAGYPLDTDNKIVNLSDDDEDLIDVNNIGLTSSSDSDELIENDIPPIIIDIPKIILNVGGKKFNIQEDWLSYLHINSNKLYKTIIDDQSHYFLDRDPFFFSQIIDIMKECEMDETKINIKDYSDQLINELCLYKLIDEKYCQYPKIKLKKVVGFVNSSRHNTIVKISIQNHTFETFLTTLLKSPFFEHKTKISKSNKICLNNIDPKIFRHVLNLLRYGQLFVYSSLIIKLLDEFHIEYIINNEKKIDHHIVSSHTYHDYDLKNQHSSMEHINIITTESTLSFGSDIIFNLTNKSRPTGDAISDLYICIDIPICNPTDNLEYVNMLEYHLIDHAMILYLKPNDGRINILTSSVSDYMYLSPIIYKKNPNDYHQMANMVEKKIKVLHNNTLIDIHRLTIPLFQFNTPLPIKQMINLGINSQLNIKISPLSNILKNNKSATIPLLNVSIIANYVNIPESNPKTYIHDKLHALNIPISNTDNPIYDIAIIPLDKMGLIKDFFFTILTKEDYLANNINKFSENLIEIDIFCMKTKKILCALDSDMLNGYIPLKKLGHKLPNGIYYHSFSSTPHKSKINGALLGTDHILRIKVKKFSEVIRLYINEHHVLY